MYKTFLFFFLAISVIACNSSSSSSDTTPEDSATEEVSQDSTKETTNVITDPNAKIFPTDLLGTYVAGDHDASWVLTVERDGDIPLAKLYELDGAVVLRLSS